MFPPPLIKLKCLRSLSWPFFLIPREQAAAMFWKFDLHTASQVEKLLEKEDVTLKELLDEEDVLQECKAQNQRLLLFLTKDSSLVELISLITHEPPTDQEEKLRYK